MGNFDIESYRKKRKMWDHPQDDTFMDNYILKYKKVPSEEEKQEYLQMFIQTRYEQPKQMIGYWRHHFFQTNEPYPFPIPNLFSLQQKEIIQQAKDVLNEYGIEEMYKGYSPCRLCSLKNNGYKEWFISYQGITYVIPFGYFHYLIDHNVKINDTLVEIVNYYLMK